MSKNHTDCGSTLEIECTDCGSNTRQVGWWPKWGTLLCTMCWCSRETLSRTQKMKRINVISPKI